MKKSMDYEVEGVRPRGEPRTSWSEVVKKDCRTSQLNKRG